MPEDGQYVEVNFVEYSTEVTEAPAVHTLVGAEAEAKAAIPTAAADRENFMVIAREKER